MRLMGLLKAYVLDINTKMNVIQKMDKFAKKHMFLGGIQRLVVDALFKFPNIFKEMAGII
jgi:hypothetical protein